MDVRKKSVGNNSDNDKERDSIYRALQEECDRIEKCNADLKTAEIKLEALMKLCQRHQASLRTNGDEPWHGDGPAADEVESLTALLMQDLELTEKMMGFTLPQCEVTFLELTDDKDSIRRQYVAVGKVNKIHFNLTLEAVMKISSGNERVSRIVEVQFQPALNELQQHVLAGTSAYLIPRALHTIQSLEDEMQEVRIWSFDHSALEIIAQPRQLMISHVPSTSVNSGVGLQLKWSIVFFEPCNNYKNNFQLTVSHDVLAQYSQSPVFPLLNKDQLFETGEHVIQFFSNFL